MLRTVQRLTFFTVCAMGLMIISCGSAPSRNIVEPRQIARQSGAPAITRVVDLGALSAIPANGPLSTKQSDGRFVIGEMVLIEGSNFGKLPTISIGNRPVESLARTASGGVLCRIPIGLDPGQQRVELSHPDGRHSRLIEVHRLGMLGARTEGKVHFFELDLTGSISRGPVLDLPGLVDLAFSHDGQAAYLATSNTIAVAAMAAPGGPEILARYPVEGEEIRALATGVNSPFLFVVGSKSLRIFDARVPTALAESGHLELPDGVLAAVTSRDGKFLVTLSIEGNSLSTLSISDPEAPALVSSVALHEQDVVPLARDLAVSPNGNEIWVVSGDNRNSIVAGTRPTTLSIVTNTNGVLALERSIKIATAGAPLAFAVSRQEAIMAAAAVRSTSQQAVMGLSTVNPALLRKNPDFKASLEHGELLAIDLDGHSRVVQKGPELYPSTLLSPDRKWFLASTRRIHSTGTSLGISVAPVLGGTPTFSMFSQDSGTDIMAKVPFALVP